MAYRPGENGSRGTIKSKPVRDALVAILSRPGDDDLGDTPKTIAQKLALSLVRDAIGGDPDARSEVIDRTDGKPAQAIIGGDEDDPPIRHLHDADKAIIDRITQQIRNEK